MARPLAIALVPLAMALACGSPAGAQSVRVPGTGVRLAPPPHFAAARQFAGFQDPESGASIVVTEIPGPASVVRGGMTREGLASRGMNLIESSAVEVDGADALLLHVTQRSDGADYFKWILVGGSEARTFMIVGTFPEDDSELSDAVRRSILSASWGDAPTRDLYEGLPFRVEPTRALKLADRMGNLLILTETGRPTGGQPGSPVLVVGSALGEVAIDDLAAFAKDRLKKTDRLRSVHVRGDSAVVVDGMQGRELLADGRDAKDGRTVSVYQLLLSDGTTYYIAQGFVQQSRWKEMLPVFRKVAGSFRRVEPPRPTITQ